MWLSDGALIVRIHSDEGGEFWNAIASEVLARTGIFQTKTKGYDPRANGRAYAYVGMCIAMPLCHFCRIEWEYVSGTGP